MAIFKLSSILKKLKCVGMFYVFENKSLKGLFGQNMKKSKILKLSWDFQYLQKLAVKASVIQLKYQLDHELAGLENGN